MTRITRINGREVDLDRIGNPKLRKVALDRCREFLFGHSDHDDKHTEGPSHTDEDRHSENAYSEKPGHDDYRNSGRSDHNEHIDRTRHQEHSDYREYHTDDHSDTRDQDGFHVDEGYADKDRYSDGHKDKAS